MEPAFGALLMQNSLLLRKVVFLILRMVADRADSQEPSSDELKVCNDILHDCAVGSPRLAVLVVRVLVPVVQGSSARPEAALVVPAPVVRVLPPGEVQEPGQRHEVAACVGEEDFELFVSVWA